MQFLQYARIQRLSAHLTGTHLGLLRLTMPTYGLPGRAENALTRPMLVFGQPKPGETDVWWWLTLFVIGVWSFLCAWVGAWLQAWLSQRVKSFEKATS